MTEYYPIYLQLQGQPCIVIGSNTLAEDKVETLLAAGARVTLIAPKVGARLQAHVESGKVIHLPRRYQPGDLKGAFLVICTNDQTAIKQQVWEEASAARQLVNVVDDTPHCNFIAPSIFRQGDLAIAISTAGKAPALAVRLKERLRKQIGPQYARFLELAGHLRAPLAQHVPDFATRKALWYRLVDSDVLDLLAQDDETAALEKISEVVGFPFHPD